MKRSHKPELKVESSIKRTSNKKYNKSAEMENMFW